jgi:hypothetical protein
LQYSFYNVYCVYVGWKIYVNFSPQNFPCFFTLFTSIFSILLSWEFSWNSLTILQFYFCIFSSCTNISVLFWSQILCFWWRKGSHLHWIWSDNMNIFYTQLHSLVLFFHHSFSQFSRKNIIFFGEKKKWFAQDSRHNETRKQLCLIRVPKKLDSPHCLVARDFFVVSKIKSSKVKYIFLFVIFHVAKSKHWESIFSVKI